MNTLFGFYFEGWLFIQACSKDKHWIIEIIDELTEGIEPTWKPDREKLENLDAAYKRQKKSSADLAIIETFVEAAKTDLADDNNKEVLKLLAKICQPTR